MNNTLNINRLGKVIKYDGASFFHNLSLTLIILWAIPVALWLIASLTPNDGHMEVYTRINMIESLTKILLILTPAALYKSCNDARKGIGYAMMPASALEKFISMVFYCAIAAPIVYIAGALAVDSILALFGGPYEGFAIAGYFNQYEQIRKVFETDMMMNPAELDEYVKMITPTFIIFSDIFSVLMLSSIFMFGNMIFKKRKTGKMIGIIVLLIILFLIVFVNYVTNHRTMFTYMDADNAEEIIKRFIYIMIRVAFVVEIVISVVMLWLTYFKIKTQKY